MAWWWDQEAQVERGNTVIVVVSFKLLGAANMQRGVEHTDRLHREGAQASRGLGAWPERGAELQHSCLWEPGQH